MKNTNRIVLINSIGTVLLHGIAFITTPIFAGKLGTENYGVYSLFITWVSILSIVFSLKIDASVPISKVRFSTEAEQKEYLSCTIFLVALTSIAFSGVMMVFEDTVITWPWFGMDHSTYRCLLLASVTFSFINYYSAKCTYSFKPLRGLIISLIKSAIYVGLSLYLINSIPKENNYLACIIGYTMSCLLPGLFALINIIVDGKLLYSRKYWAYAITISLPLVFHSLSTVILSQSDRLMINYFLGASETGIYSLAVSFSNVMIVIWTALNQSWSPFFFEFIKNRQFDEVYRRTSYFIEVFSSLCIGFALLCPEVFHFYAGVDFWGGTKFVLLFTISTYFTFLYSLIANYEMTFEHTKIIAVATIISGIVNIVLNYIFIGVLGSLGAVVATVVSHVVLFAIHYTTAHTLIDCDLFVYKLRMFIIPTIIVCSICIIGFFVETRYFLLRIILFCSLTIWETARLLKRKTIF